MTTKPPFDDPTDNDNGFAELRAGSLGTRLATTPAETDAAKALRFRIFYRELGATADPATVESERDQDVYDAVADHLLVIDHNIGPGPECIVGTCRLIPRAAAAKVGSFYTAAEYDIAPILAFPGRILELGRSCVAAPYRSRTALQLMWLGIMAYTFRHKIDLMFGCASLLGTDPDALAQELTYLQAFHLAPPALRPRALPQRYVEMCRMDSSKIDARKVLSTLPPLLKGYLRLGGFIGDGAVIDPQFNTTDVAIMVKTALITDKYYRHWQRQLSDAWDPSGVRPG